MMIISVRLHAKEHSMEMDFTVLFHQDLYNIDTTYRSNAEQVNAILDMIDSIYRDSTIQLKQIEIRAFASPDGLLHKNMILSNNRAKSLRNYILANAPSGCLSDTLFALSNDTYSWEHALEYIGCEEYKWLLKGTTNPFDIKARLLYYNKGAIWKKLEKDGFPYLRMGCMVNIRYDLVLPSLLPERVQMVEVLPPDTDDILRLSKPVIPKILEDTAAFRFAIKTNLLEDAIALPNLGVEFALGKRFSLSASWMHGWWPNADIPLWMRAYGGELNFRYWFGSNVDFKGHHIGIYGQAFLYDFCRGKNGVMSGPPGGTMLDDTNYAAGIEYGYSILLHPHLTLDFVLGVGYMGGLYHNYVKMDDCKVWQLTGQRHWVGPTKAEITLRYEIGKGGVR